MGQPVQMKSAHKHSLSQRRELKHLSTCRKRKKASISKVVASEMERAQTAAVKAVAGL